MKRQLLGGYAIDVMRRAVVAARERVSLAQPDDEYATAVAVQLDVLSRTLDTLSALQA